MINRISRILHITNWRNAGPLSGFNKPIPGV